MTFDASIFLPSQCGNNASVQQRQRCFVMGTGCIVPRDLTLRAHEREQDADDCVLPTDAPSPKGAGDVCFIFSCYDSTPSFTSPSYDSFAKEVSSTAFAFAVAAYVARYPRQTSVRRESGGGCVLGAMPGKKCAPRRELHLIARLTFISSNELVVRLHHCEMVSRASSVRIRCDVEHIPYFRCEPGSSASLSVNDPPIRSERRQLASFSTRITVTGVVGSPIR